MQGQHGPQSSFFGLIYDELVPPGHLPRRIAASVDFAFVSGLIRDCYCPDNGRPSWDPLVLFKVVFLLFDKLRVVSNVEPQFLYDLPDREVEEHAHLHLARQAADKGYHTDANHQRLKDTGQRSSIIVKKNRIAAEIIAQGDPNSQRERPGLERKFAEQKRYHGLGVARYWGLVKVSVQTLLTCIAVNCKWIVKLLNRVTKLAQGALCPAGRSGG